MLKLLPNDLETTYKTFFIQWLGIDPRIFITKSFRLTVTKWIQDGIATIKIDLIGTLDAWRKVYKAVANPAKAGYLYKDLSFDNVRLERSSDNEIAVKLIDYSTSISLIKLEIWIPR